MMPRPDFGLGAVFIGQTGIIFASRKINFADTRQNVPRDIDLRELLSRTIV